MPLGQEAAKASEEPLRRPVKRRRKTGIFHTSKILLSEVFLPAGFPSTVSPDYIHYQVYDSLQAFCSTIAGLLSSRAVLEGFGVGDQNATATHAMMLSMVQDAFSRLATIIFAWRLGTALEPETKMYRLAADFFNDCAIIIDCLCPALPSNYRVIALCMSGILRSLCGVSAGGAKAALSAHFAKSGNVAELNAKDSSQETVIGLLGMLCGSFVVSRITSRNATWASLFLLILVHLGTNYLAVRSVVMTSLNRQRSNILWNVYRRTRQTPTPTEASSVEQIFDYDGAIRHAGVFVGTCTIATFDSEHLQLHCGAIDELSSICRGECHVMWFLRQPTTRNYKLCIWFKRQPSAPEQIKAWVHAVELTHVLSQSKERITDETMAESVQKSLATVRENWENLMHDAAKVGWDVSVGSILTTSLWSSVQMFEENPKLE